MEWWQEFFDAAYVEAWEADGAFEGTREQVGELIRFLGLAPGARVLDLPCGFGRFAGPLAIAGYDVVGVDASQAQIELARERHPGPQYVVGDMREPPDGPFDAVLNLYSSFGYFDDPADDRRCVEAWFEVLRPGGVLVLELRSRDSIAWLYGQPFDAGARMEEGVTDWVTGVRTSSVEVAGERRRFRLRLYTPTELVAMLHDVGFTAVEAYGAFDGRPVDPTNRLAVRAVRP